MRLMADEKYLHLGHPSVKHGSSAGAIGILGVKKDTDGIHLYFAHNTDSFVSPGDGHVCCYPRVSLVLERRRTRCEIETLTNGGWCSDTQALASMHSDEPEPLCAMSRSRGNGSIAQGGRPIRLRRKK